MSELATHAHGLINAASAAIAASRKEPPATLTLLARMIVSEAKRQRPNDAAIQSIDLEGNIPAWNDINLAMNVIVRTLVGISDLDSYLAHPNAPSTIDARNL